MFEKILLYALIQEGPHSALNEDEFFDALEMAYQQDEMVMIPSFLPSFQW